MVESAKGWHTIRLSDESAEFKLQMGALHVLPNRETTGQTWRRGAYAHQVRILVFRVRITLNPKKIIYIL